MAVEVSRVAVAPGDRLFRAGTGLFATSILLLVGLFAVVLWTGSAEARQAFGWSFVTQTAWNPVTGSFGALPFIQGTLLTSALALLLAVPLGLGTAIFLAEMAPPRVSQALASVIELLAAVPSVVYGLVGIFVVVPWVRDVLQPALAGAFGDLPLVGGLLSGPPRGVSVLAAGLVLAIMVVPYVTSVSRQVLLAVPSSLKEAAAALGATRWEVVRLAVLPCARSGIAASVMLALARALGETMAVTMVIGNRPDLVRSLFEPGYTLAALLANEFAEATSDLYLSVLVEMGLVLFAITILINGMARLMLHRLAVPSRG